MTTCYLQAEFSKFTRNLSLITIIAWAIAPRAFAQAEPALDLHLYAGLNITGAVGTVHSIEYVTDLAQTNNPSAWRCLEFVKLPASPYLWADKSVAATGSRFYRVVAMEARENMVFIPPGTFRMGSPTNEVGRQDYEGPQTDVIIGQGFWMGKNEVTQGEYMAVMGNNPSFFQPPNGSEDMRRPVEMVSWEDANNYCARLTERERAAGRIPTKCVYRLPTEVEWEYACRAWTSSRFSYGDDPDCAKLTDYAWYGAIDGEQTHPVGQKLPNSWGLHDMHGNVNEWCRDLINVGSEIRNMQRGGHWNAPEWMCRSAFPLSIPLGIRLKFIGFRTVLAPEPS